MNTSFHHNSGAQTKQEAAAILLLSTSRGSMCLNIDSIIRIEASSNYSKVFCNGQTLPVVASKVLRWFEERLPRHLFIRVHRTHLLNKQYVAAMKNNHVILESGMQISISRRKRKSCLIDGSA